MTEDDFKRLLEVNAIATRAHFDEVAAGMAEKMDVIETRLSARIDALAADMDRRFAIVDQRFDAVDRHLEVVDGRLETVDRRLSAVDGRLETVDRRLGTVETRVEEVRRGLHARIDAVRQELQLVAEGVSANTERLDRLDAKFDKLADDLDVRVTRLEATPRKSGRR